ncbi:MAG: hypothetical protein WBD29_09635, partial [Candidatus Competibacter sp.]
MNEGDTAVFNAGKERERIDAALFLRPARDDLSSSQVDLTQRTPAFEKVEGAGFLFLTQVAQ